MDLIQNNSALYLVWCFVSLLFFSCEKNSREYYQNGRLKSECWSNEENAQLYCKFFYESGGLKEIRIKKSVQDLVVRKYHPNMHLSTVVTYKNRSVVNAKNYDKNGVLMNESGKNRVWKFYQYYKSRKLYCIDFMRRSASGKEFQTDSAYIFPYSGEGKILQFKIAENGLSKREVVIHYGPHGRQIHVDTLRGEAHFEQIIFRTLQKDTLELYYQPVM